MYKKAWSHAKLLFCKSKPTGFLLNCGPIVVIQKFGYHGNLMSHFPSLLVTCLGVFYSIEASLAELLRTYDYFFVQIFQKNVFFSTVRGKRGKGVLGTGQKV